MWQNAQAIELWIINLGKSHSSLINANLVPAIPLIRLYENSSTLELIPCPGVVLSFWFETQRFESLHISLAPQKNYVNQIYTGGLPAPYSSLKNRFDVIKILGLPYKSIDSQILKDNNFLGFSGWDFYEFNEASNSNFQVEFQYSATEEICTISFSLFDRES